MKKLEKKDPAYYGCKSIPVIGQEIYVSGAMYMSHGEDDFAGGRAEIDSVREDISGGCPAIFISIKERPGHGYNWKFLEDEQEKLAKAYGNERAHPDPDDRPEFNCWVSPGDIVGESFRDSSGKWVHQTRVATKHEK
jgi:hypothetical protein